MEEKIELEVKTTTDGEIEIIQGDHLLESHVIRITPDQVEILIEWLKAARIELQCYEIGQREFKPLKRSVLQSLKEHGPHSYDALYAEFSTDSSTATVQLVLQELLEWNYIRLKAEDKTMIEITEHGLTLLEKGTDW